MERTEYNLTDLTVIVPSYQPDEGLVTTLKGIADAGFTDILVVDDGGGAAFAPVFTEAARIPGVTVLTHETNRGKGAALKTAFQYVLEHRPDSAGVVTADGDGQHLVSDIRAVAERMLERNRTVLGSRDFSGADIPARSRFGNNVTRGVFRFLVGIRIHDTQTGLRAFPVRFLPDLLTVPGNRYEYETNVLIFAKRLKMDLTEETISTVYIDDNAGSHFRPVRDSIRIYSFLLFFILSSLLAAGVDHLAFFLLKLFAAPYFGVHNILICTVIARILSGAVNFMINRRVVFRNPEHTGRKLLRYAGLAVLLVFLSSGFVRLFSSLFGTDQALFVTLIKMAVDTLLFFASYRIQREWVFRD